MTGVWGKSTRHHSNATSPDTVPALAQPQFHCRITDLLLPSVGTLKEGEKGRRVRPFCLVGTEYRCAYNVSGVPQRPTIPWENAKASVEPPYVLPGPSNSAKLEKENPAGAFGLTASGAK